jgi:condensin complex subunit 2
MMQVEITNTKSNSSKNFDEEVAKVIELTKFNKINAKNAFDIDVGFIQSITSMLVSKDEESAWQKASASLDATAKIYGYRVDSVHTETFKFLGGLNRNKKDINIKEDNENNNEEESKEEVVEEIKKKEKVRKGVNTLETNIKKLNLSKYDIDSDIDPLFSLMTSKFNDSTAKGLLLNTIPLDEKINYILESKKVDDKPHKAKSDSKNKQKPKEETDIDTQKKRKRKRRR